MITDLAALALVAGAWSTSIVAHDPGTVIGGSMTAVGGVALGWAVLPLGVTTRAVRWTFSGLGLLAAATLGYQLTRAGRSFESWLFGVGVVWLVAAVVIVVGNLRSTRGATPVAIASPFATGRFMVLQGGGGLVNHHGAEPSQRFAVDVVGDRAVRRGWARTGPETLEDFRIFGTPVLSPVAGTVVGADDGLDDLGGPSPAAGNSVRIRIDGDDGFVVLIAHLRSGSVRVHPGEWVAEGEPIGEVGNSGNSTEPHLHLHIVDGAGRAVPMAIAGRRRPPWRNDTVRGQPRP